MGSVRNMNCLCITTQLQVQRHYELRYKMYLQLIFWQRGWEENKLISCPISACWSILGSCLFPSKPEVMPSRDIAYCFRSTTVVLFSSFIETFRIRIVFVIEEFVDYLHSTVCEKFVNEKIRSSSKIAPLE